MTYKTPTANLRRIFEDDNSDNFKIILKFGNKNSQSNLKQNKNTNKIEINTTINRARVISKNINHIYLVDPTVDKYEIKFPTNCNRTAEYPKKIRQLFRKLLNSILEEVTINEEDHQDFTRLLIHLGEKNITAINNIGDAMSLLFTKFHDESILYLSSRLKEFISKKSIEKIERETVYEIIDTYFENCSRRRGNKKSNKEEVEEIFEEMKKKINDHRIVIHFLIGLEKCDMNDSMIEYLYEHLDDDIVECEMSRLISIVRQHYFEIETTKKPVKKEGEIEVNFEGDELKGICNYLKSNKGKTVGKDTNLMLSGGGWISPSNPLTNLIKYNEDEIDDYFDNYCEFNPVRSQSEGWIEFDFCKQKVCLSSYTIRSNDGDPNSDLHPKSWRIVGSNNKKSWDVIDNRRNNAALNGSNRQHRFECTGNNKNYYRYIRYVQEDAWINDSRKYNICLTCFELFGSISTSKE